MRKSSSYCSFWAQAWGPPLTIDWAEKSLQCMLTQFTASSSPPRVLLESTGVDQWRGPETMSGGRGHHSCYSLYGQRDPINQFSTGVEVPMCSGMINMLVRTILWTRFIQLIASMYRCHGLTLRVYFILSIILPVGRYSKCRPKAEVTEKTRTPVKCGDIAPMFCTILLWTPPRHNWFASFPTLSTTS